MNCDFHQNKDWNYIKKLALIYSDLVWIVTSTKTRIETFLDPSRGKTTLKVWIVTSTKTRIETKTDFNWYLWVFSVWIVTSTKTRIETHFHKLQSFILLFVWIVTSTKTRIETMFYGVYNLPTSGFELWLPPKQGLKQNR